MTGDGEVGGEATSKPVELYVIDGGRRGGTPPPPPPEGQDGAAIFGSDIALKEALVRELGGRWRSAAGEIWHRWDGRVWRRDELRAVWAIATRVCRSQGALAEPKSISLARNIQSKSSIYAAVSLAAVDTQVATPMAAFDADPWLLNTPLGIVDLRTSQIAPHDAGALMTKMAGAGPSHVECPTFQKYLVEVTGGDEALQQYLQRVAGYCLTGSIEEHCILFLHGPGGSGKSTFLLVIQDLLADYAVNSPMNAFTVTTGERHPTELAHFFGARVVTASEIEEGMRWDEGKLKAISGGDKITARYMRGDFFTFEPQFKLLLAGNHRPRMRSADDAMRRRMQVVPFRHKPTSVDKQLREKLRAELGGILVWAIEGEQLRRRLGGLNPPAAILEATERYFADENTIDRWLGERCRYAAATEALARCAPNDWSETRALHQDYGVWARRAGEFVLSERSFVQKLEQMPGVDRAQHPRTRKGGFRGIVLRYVTDDLPGIDQAAEQAMPARGIVRANELPLAEASDDPAENWPRE